MMGIILLILVITGFCLWFFQRKKKKKLDDVDNSADKISGYRIRFFKNNKEVDSKIIR